MNDFAVNVLTKNVPKSCVAVFFLGQAGFVIKTDENKLIAIDPYLSDCCNRYFGFKRLMPYILKPDELELDYLLVSHAHYDHFDPDSVPVLMSNGKTEMIGAYDTKAECERLNISGNVTYIASGDTVSRGNIKVTAVPCDHGELAPDAVGLLIEVGNKKIYYMGDTAYRTDLLDNKLLTDIDLLILPINGAFGNLDEKQAADIAGKIKAGKTVPCHYWNFAEHGGNPDIFAKEMKESAPKLDTVLMRPGECTVI